MAPKLSLEARMTIIELLRRGWSRIAIVKTLRVTEGAVRYHERRRREGQTDGRLGRQRYRVEELLPAIEAWLATDPLRCDRLDLAALHDYFVAEHGYETGRVRGCRSGSLIGAVAVWPTHGR
jgi:hypothetical protein